MMFGWDDEDRDATQGPKDIEGDGAALNLVLMVMACGVVLMLFAVVAGRGEFGPALQAIFR